MREQNFRKKVPHALKGQSTLKQHALKGAWVFYPHLNHPLLSFCPKISLISIFYPPKARQNVSKSLIFNE